MKITMSQEELRKALGPKMKFMSMKLEEFIKQLDEMGVEKPSSSTWMKRLPAG